MPQSILASSSSDHRHTCAQRLREVSGQETFSCELAPRSTALLLHHHLPPYMDWLLTEWMACYRKQKRCVNLYRSSDTGQKLQAAWDRQMRRHRPCPKGICTLAAARSYMYLHWDSREHRVWGSHVRRLIYRVWPCHLPSLGVLARPLSLSLALLVCESKVMIVLLWGHCED